MISVQNLMPMLLAADEMAVRGTPREWMAVVVVGVLLLIGLIVFTYTTKAGIIARATTKEAVRQPVFLLCMALAIVILFINTVLPFFSLGDDVKISSIRRAGARLPQSEAGTPLQEGDMLILLGTPTAISDAESTLLAGR